MKNFIPTIILRHRRENLKKCSLRGLEHREDLLFFTYPIATLPKLSNYVLLSMNGPSLTIKDRDKGVFLIDGTWRYATKMEANCSLPETIERRSLPGNLLTAYPRRQEDCSDPTRGLASVEALFAAYVILKRNPEGLLDHYYWKADFLKLNPSQQFPLENFRIDK